MKCTQCRHALYMRRPNDGFALQVKDENGLFLRCNYLHRNMPVSSTDSQCSSNGSHFVPESCIDPKHFIHPPDPLSDHFQRALALHNRKKGGKPLTIKLIPKLPPL